MQGTNPTIRLSKPPTQRVRVTIRDPEAGTSKTMTVYGTTINGLVGILKNLATSESRPTRPAA